MSDDELIRLLRAELEYRSDGRLFWRPRSIPDFPLQDGQSLRGVKSFNTKFAGKEALAVVDDGYKQGCYKGKKLYAHRAVWAIWHGRFPAMIDHINRQRLDNRIENLREVTPAENSKNMSMRRDNVSGVKGVHFSKLQKIWTARIGVDGVWVNLGVFQNEDDAVSARKRAEREHGYFE